MVFLFWLTGWQQTLAGEKYQIQLMAAPSMEWLRFDAPHKGFNDVFGTKFSYNFGFHYTHFLSPRFSLSTGLQFQNKGFRNKNDVTLLSTGETVEAITIGAARFFTVPGNMNFHIKLAKKTNLLVSTGLSYGYLANQTFNGVNYPDEEVTENGTLFNFSSGRSNVNVFNKSYLGLNLGLGVEQYIKSKLVFTVQSVYQRQLSRAIGPDAPILELVDTHFNSIRLDFRLGYYFNRNIDNKSKEF